MNEYQVQNIYKANGLGHGYMLRNADDLMRTHGIDYKRVAGYENLSDENKEIFERFILNFYNIGGLSWRMRLMPSAIYYAEEISYAVEKDSDYFYAGCLVTKIDKNGNRKVVLLEEDEDYKDLKKIARSPEYYLRFEYKSGEYDEWLHVTNNGTQWY